MLNSSSRGRLPRHLTAALVVGAVAGLTIAGTITTKTVHGRMRATAEGSAAVGRFAMSVTERGERSKEKLHFTASGLDALRGDDGSRPAYTLVLVTSGDDEADLGSVKLRRNGDAKLKYSSRRDTLGEGFDGLEDFGGGTIELRDGENVLLEGAVPEFLAAGDDPEPGDGATFEARNSRKLSSDDDESRARGFVSALSKFKPKSDYDRIFVEVVGAGRSGAELTVVAIDRDDAETELGTMRLRGRLKTGVLKIDTRSGDEIPGGSIGDLGGQRVEVRNGDDVVLSGRFPSLATGQDSEE
jgi:hypothetical protein